MKQLEHDPLQSSRVLLDLFYPGSFPDPLHLPIEPVMTAPTPNLPGDYMTTEEVAAYVKRSPNTIRQWCRLDTFPYIILPGRGGDRVFSKKMVDSWMEERAFNVPTE